MAKGGFDYSEYIKFAKQLTEVDEGFQLWLKSFLLEIGQRTLALTKQRQEYVGAVDTGNMLNAWFITDVITNGDELSFTIANSMEYSSYVEYGHSQEPGRYVPAIGRRLVNDWVPGRYIVTVAIDEIEKQIPRRFEKAFENYMKSKGLG